jgi:hypothetical protein
VALDATVDWGTLALMAPAQQATSDGPGPTVAPWGATWIRCADLLAAPEGFTAWRARIAEAVGRGLGSPPAVVPGVVLAAYQLGWYADVIGWAAGALFHRERRVPSCDPAHIWFRLDDGAYPADVALTQRRFACLPQDPQAAHPDADVVADEPALAALLRARVVAHAAAFLAVWEPEVRLGSRTRWGAISDLLDCAPWAAGMAAGDEAAGVASAAVVMAGASSPLVPGTRIYRGQDHHRRPFHSRHRHTCCFAFRLPEHRACFSCPRVSDAQRCEWASGWPDSGPPTE